MDALKKSFFKDYFLYKLRGFRGTAVASAVMNFFSTTFLGAGCLLLVYLGSSAYEGYDPFGGGYGLLFLSYVILGIFLLAAAVETIIVTFSPLRAFRSYNRRPVADMIGCLPLTYSQRFWGDFLSGLCANLISFIPCAAAGIPFMAAAQSIARKSADMSVDITPDYVVPTYLSVILLLFVGYLAAYAVSCFIAACCGRAGTSAVYTLISLFIPAGFALIYGFCVFGDAVGVNVMTEVSNALSAIPPVGVWASVIARAFDARRSYRVFRSLWYLTDQPVYLVVSLLIIAALIVGAYLLGKRRKCERTGGDFVFRGAYHVISTALAAFVIGFFFMVKEFSFSIINFGERNVELIDIVFSAGAAFVVYAVAELVHTRSFGKLWQTALKFAGICAVCFGTIALAQNTGGFGAEKRLPVRSAIAEVRVSGSSMLYRRWDDALIYRSNEAISAILEENKRIVNNAGDNICTGDALTITYMLKDGRTVTRGYSSDYDAVTNEMRSKILADACANIRKLTPTDSSALGFIDDPRYDSISIRYIKYAHDNNTAENASDTNVPEKTVYVTEGKEDELMELLKNDTLFNHKGEYTSKNSVGTVWIEYTVDGAPGFATYYILDDYADTLAFLDDPENLRGSPAAEEEFIYFFSVYSNVDYDEAGRAVGLMPIKEFRLTVSSADDSEAARELLSFAAPYDEMVDEVSDYITVHSSSPQGGALGVRKRDESAVIRAMVKYARESAEREGVIS